MTPVFFGANPAHVPAAAMPRRLPPDRRGGGCGLLPGPLAGGGRAQQAVIADRSLGDIVSGPGRELALQRFEGVPLARLNEAQRDGVMRILQLYAGTMREEIAAAALAKVREAGLEALHFAWAGSLAPRPPALFPRARADGAHRVRQHAGRRQPRALGVDRPAEPVRPRPAQGALPGRALKAMRAAALCLSGERT